MLDFLDDFDLSSTEKQRLYFLIKKHYESVDLDEILTAAEVEEIYALASGSVRVAVRRGQVPARKAGRIWLIRRQDAERIWGYRRD